MQIDGKNLFSKRVSGGTRTYFLDVCKSIKNGDPYLLITESRKMGEEWIKTRLVVFPDHIEELRDGLEEIIRFMKKSVSSQV